MTKEDNNNNTGEEEEGYLAIFRGELDMLDEGRRGVFQRIRKGKKEWN